MMKMEDCEKADENGELRTQANSQNQLGTVILNVAKQSVRPGITNQLEEGGTRLKGKQKINLPESPLISVITVVFNGELSLRGTIKSVLEQSYQNIEYIIIDGGSTDGTLDIIREYDNLIDFWISEKDEGISDAFNKGIKYATGELIGILNADDWYEKNAVEIVSKNYQKNPNLNVLCGNVQYWKNGLPDYLYSSDPTRLKKEMTINHPSCFVSRCTYMKYGAFLKHYYYAMDYELMLRLFVSGASFESIDSTIANMRLDGASDKHWLKALSEARTAKQNLLKLNFEPWIYWTFQVLRRKTRQTFARFGFTTIINLYRLHFSVLKKSR